MLSKYYWLSEELLFVFSDMLKMGELAVNADLFIKKLLEVEGVDNILSKIQKNINDHQGTTRSVLLYYFLDFLKIYNGLYLDANFKTKKDREKTKLKISQSCDFIIKNIPILDVDKFVGTVDAENCSVVKCNDECGCGDLLVFLKISDVLEKIKEISEMDMPKSLTKVSVRDARFNYFCRELRLINTKWFNAPYWECISLFAYSFVEGAPESKDKITSVRNACGLTQ